MERFRIARIPYTESYVLVDTVTEMEVHHVRASTHKIDEGIFGVREFASEAEAAAAIPYVVLVDGMAVV